MSMRINDTNVEAAAAVTTAAKPASDADLLRAARSNKARSVTMPTDEEDAAITRAALSDPDNPPLTDEQLAQLKPARRGRGRPVQEATKVPTSIRFDNLVLDSFKAFGDGWQTRINDVLMEYLVETQQLHHRFHATVQATGNEQSKVGEFVVVALDSGQAKEKVKQHLRAAGRDDDARGQVFTVDIGNAAIRDLPVIQ